MINKWGLTQLFNQNIMTQYAALTDEDKAALLTCKQNDKMLFEEAKTKLQFLVGFVDLPSEVIEENIKLECVVKCIEDGKLQLALKRQMPMCQPLLSEKTIEAFTQFELPLDRKILMETYRQLLP